MTEKKPYPLTQQEWIDQGLPFVWLRVRRCSICNAWIGYELNPLFPNPGFNANCNCTSRRGDGEDRTWQEWAEAVEKYYKPEEARDAPA